MELEGIKEKELLKKHCSFQVGGEADFFYEAKKSDEIIKAIKAAKSEKIPYYITGKGANIIFSDKGFRGLIIKNSATEIKINGEVLEIESGALLTKVAQEAAEANLAGFEPLAWIPGTIGGAVYGNAGTKEGEIKDLIESVETYDSEKDEVSKTKPEFGYRDSSFKRNDLVILKVHLKLQKTDKIDEEEVKKQLQVRVQKQPKGFSAGSFFKNPSKDLPAGYLLDQAGCKGLQMGNAQISLKHANFFLNLGNATQNDIVELAKMAKERVKSHFEVDLQPEVRILDEFGDKIKI
jgi:UDP-N-acetylmuramate dehydrogenase